MDLADLGPDPLAQLEAWIAEAEARGIELAAAFALGHGGERRRAIGADGTRPRCRRARAGVLHQPPEPEGS